MNCCLHLISIIILMELLTPPSSKTYVILRRRSVSGAVAGSIIQKRSLDLELPKPEYVCPTTLLKRNTPQFGHMRNGSFVQIQQDSEHSFVATVVECTNGQFRPPCHGIDTILYSSECVTMYEWRFAYVRLPNHNVEFVPAEIKIPVACQCRIFKNLKPQDRCHGTWLDGDPPAFVFSSYRGRYVTRSEVPL